MEAYQAWGELSKLHEGSQVELQDGKNVTFIKLNSKNFVGIMDGKTYNVPISLFKKVLKIVEKNEDYLKLKDGEFFYISNGKEALIYQFVGMEKNQIIGMNPINLCRTKISPGMYAGRISELQKNMDKLK